MSSFLLHQYWVLTCPLCTCYNIGVTQTSTGENIMSIATTIAESILSLPHPLRIIIGITGMVVMVIIAIA